MLSKERVNELIKEFDLHYDVRNGVEGICILENTTKFKRSKKVQSELKENKPQLIEELKRIKAEKEAADEAKKQEEKAKIEAEKNEYRNGTKKFKMKLEDYDYPHWVIYGAPAELLREIGVAHWVAYNTQLTAEAEKALGTSFTYQEAMEYIKPINEAKAQKEKEKQEKIAKIFAKAKETGKKQELNSWMAPCNDPHEECSTDIVTIYAMPDGTTTKHRQHTW